MIMIMMLLMLYLLLHRYHHDHQHGHAYKLLLNEFLWADIEYVVSSFLPNLFCDTFVHGRSDAVRNWHQRLCVVISAVCVMWCFVQGQKWCCMEMSFERRVSTFLPCVFCDALCSDESILYRNSFYKKTRMALCQHFCRVLLLCRDDKEMCMSQPHMIIW